MSPTEEDTLFSFDADERLFVAHAFMNVGGYDMEYHADGMHPIRAEIRALLQQRLPESYRDSIRQYYEEHDHYLGYYGTYAFALAPPPQLTLEFKSESSSPWVSEQVEALPDLDVWLREFYDRAGMAEIWRSYRLRLQALHDQYRPHAAQALEHLEAYLGSEATSFRSGTGGVVTAVSPLLSYFQAFTVTVNGQVYLVFGPQPGEPSPASYYHEVAHHFVDEIVEERRDAAERLTPLLELAQHRAGSLAYAVVEESLVRAIDIILSARLFGLSPEKVAARASEEYRLGFILCPYFVEHLREYEASGQPFRAYYLRLLAGVDVEGEQQRWAGFRSSE